MLIQIEFSHKKKQDLYLNPKDIYLYFQVRLFRIVSVKKFLILLAAVYILRSTPPTASPEIHMTDARIQQ